MNPPHLLAQIGTRAAAAPLVGQRRAACQARVRGGVSDRVSFVSGVDRVVKRLARERVAGMASMPARQNAASPLSRARSTQVLVRFQRWRDRLPARAQPFP